MTAINKGKVIIFLWFDIEIFFPYNMVNETRTNCLKPISSIPASSGIRIYELHPTQSLPTTTEMISWFGALLLLFCHRRATETRDWAFRTSTNFQVSSGIRTQELRYSKVAPYPFANSSSIAASITMPYSNVYHVV